MGSARPGGRPPGVLRHRSEGGEPPAQPGRDAKLTGHATAKAPDGEINGGSAAWNPTLLEITVAGCAAGDRPVDWAMWVQQQRFPDHYRDEGLKLPLALHLAGKTTEYALPQEYAEARLLEDVPEDGVSDDGTDGTEETGGALALADDEGEAEGAY